MYDGILSYTPVGKRPHVTMNKFYNFLLQERSGEVNLEYLTPAQELDVYIRHRNKGLPVAARHSLPAKKKIWNDKLEIEGEDWTIAPHPVSFQLCCQKEDKDGKTKYKPLPPWCRREEKKNPILYGERLKLFYLCDQGVKIENNNLRFHENEKQQKKYNTVDFKMSNDMADRGEVVQGQGRRYKLPSSYNYGKRNYAQRYYDAMAVCLHTSRPDLFVTATGTTVMRELYRLRDNRSDTELVELANRIFALKLKELLHDIVKKQIFGKVVGRIWVIE